VFVPSEWHQQTLLEDVSKFTSIIPNGIFEDFLVDGTNANDRFIYARCTYSQVAIVTCL
jgi:hypothetical protein